MQSYDGYITIDSSVPSKSGRYVVGLPGITIKHLHSLTKEEQDDYFAFFDQIYENAQIDLKTDVQLKLKDSFHYNQKLVSRETSEYLTEFNSGSELAGIKIKYGLPKYAKIQILTIEVKSEVSQASPEPEFYIYKEDETGELLSTISSEITAGRNVIAVDQDFYEDELFIAYNPDSLSLSKTKNRYFRGAYNFSADFCAFPCFGEEGSIQQVNGGGLNVTFIVMCDIQKFILENLPIFRDALWYKIGVEFMEEVIVSDRVNPFTVLTTERAAELLAVYTEKYDNALMAATQIVNISEDPICFSCKRSIGKVTSLP